MVAPTLPSRSVAPMRATEAGEKKLIIGEWPVIWGGGVMDVVRESSRAVSLFMASLSRVMRKSGRAQESAGIAIGSAMRASFLGAHLNELRRLRLRGNSDCQKTLWH